MFGFRIWLDTLSLKKEYRLNKIFVMRIEIENI